MKIKDLPRFKRPREKLLEKGKEALTDAELLAILLRTGYAGKSALEVARRILEKQKLSDLAKIPLKNLAKIKGFGLSRAAAISASFEIGKRVYERFKEPVVENVEDILRSVHFLKNKKQENLIALYLNARNAILKISIISVGTLTESIVHPREVFAGAISYNAAKIILVHNHPSNDPTPSVDDLAITKRLVEAGKILGIEIAEHLIVTKNGWRSCLSSRKPSKEETLLTPE